MRKSATRCLPAAVLLAGCATTPTPVLLQKVQLAEIMVHPTDPALREAVRSGDPVVRRAAMRALARIEATASIAQIQPRLTDPDPEVRRWAAFALGQIGPSALPALEEALDEPSVDEVGVLRALGRVGTSTSARRLVSRIQSSDLRVRAAAAMAIGLIAKRVGASLVAADFVPALLPLLRESDPEVRFGAVYGLMRLSSPEATAPLSTMVTDPDPEIRANAVRGLGASGAPPTVYDGALEDPDWRVRVEAARALARVLADDRPAAAQVQATERLIRLGLRAVRSVGRDPIRSGVATHVVRAVIDSAGSYETGRPILVALERAVADLAPGGSIPDAERIRCRLAASLDRLDGRAGRVNGCVGYLGWRQRAIQLGVLAAAKPSDLNPIVAELDSVDARVRTAAVEALASIGGAEAQAALVPALNREDDPLMVAAAASGLVPASEQPDPALLPALVSALERLRTAEDTALIVLVIDAMARFGPAGVEALQTLRDDARPAIRRRLVTAKASAGLTGPSPSAMPWPNIPAGIHEIVRLRIETKRGNIVVELDGTRAPRVAGALRWLTENRRYDGLTFHRVVSDFVAQGGCPRGDGWGGPGFNVPGEVSPERFVRGAVGIATNGRDTGGSQFFIMHSHHPHLDGGYPWVGRVVAAWTWSTRCRPTTGY